MTEHSSGRISRRKILAELYRREGERLPAPTMRELASLLGIPPQSILYHCRILRGQELLTWDPRQARTLRLTETGLADAERAAGKKPLG